MFDSNRVFVAVSFLGVLLLSLSGTMVLGSSTAYADPPNTVLATVKYCKSKMPKNLDSQCTEGNMNRLRAAVNDGCSGKNQDACVENAAEKYVDQIAGQHPKNAKDFNDALDAAISDASG